jgi:hypothetical protein
MILYKFVIIYTFHYDWQALVSRLNIPIPAVLTDSYLKL